MSRTKSDLLGGITKPYKSAKRVDNNTYRIEYEDGSIAIRLHDTDVVTFKGDTITLNSGGWQTVTTKDRINEHAPIYIVQRKGQWFAGAKEHRFYDGMQFNYMGELLTQPLPNNDKEVADMKKKIKKYVDLITPDNLPTPSNGDCWFCLMRDKDGKTMGDLSKDNDHLLSHLDEGYLHGSILVNAMNEAGYVDRQIAVHYSMKLASTFKRAVRKYLTKRLIK